MSKREIENEQRIYYEQYGDIPLNVEDRIAYILGKWATNDRINNDIIKRAKNIRRIKKEKIEFTMYKVLNPSARPRANTRMGYIKMYVPHAADNAEWFESYIKDKNLPIIETPCKMDIKIYEATPVSFSMRSTVLAELGLIRPWKRTGDVDNYAKSVLDMIQHGLLFDDCLVYSSTIDLLYSILPRVEVKIEYYSKFPNE